MVVANLVSLGDEFVTQDLGVKVAVKKLHFITGKERDRFLNVRSGGPSRSSILHLLT